MKKPITYILIFFVYNINAQQTFCYKNNVGDIELDSLTDNINFPLTGEKIRQYYNFFPSIAIKEDKSELISYFNKNFTPSINNLDSGYITVRFIVNFKGDTDRFRIQQMDVNYCPKIFQQELLIQLLQMVKGIKDWKVAANKEKEFDYYQYITFVIEKGNIKMILP